MSSGEEVQAVSLLPAIVPEIPEARAAIVPARLARKVAPLFGVPWPEGPFGRRTWVSDFARLTLSEIARGAPLPARSEAEALTKRARGEWDFVERVGVTSARGSLPNEIANTTLNRFGPDTKAAVVLEAVNVLLDPVRHAVDQALPLLVADDGAPLESGPRLAGWAALVVETFRTQPALVAAGIRARAIQRQLDVGWELPLAPSARNVPLTRCEISAHRGPGAGSHPTSLELVDETFQRLALLNGSETNALAREQRHEETVGLLLHQLLAAGTLRDESHLWLSERAPDQLAVEAFIPPTSLIDRFVRQTMRSAGLAEPWRTQPKQAMARALPAVPDPQPVLALPSLGRRAIVLALLGVLRHVQAEPVIREAARWIILERLDTLADLVERVLPADDPVGAVARCRLTLTRVHLRRPVADHDLGTDLALLMRQSEACAQLNVAGRLDRGAAAEITAAANIEVGALRWSNATRPDAGLPDPEELDRWLRTSWEGFLGMLEVPEDLLSRRDVELPGLLGIHLHNYASFLGSHTDDEDDLLAAVRLHRDVVIPARERYFERSGSFESLRRALQLATRPTTALAERLAAAGDRRGAQQWAALGLAWTRRVLDADETQRLLETPIPTESALRLVLRAVPALVVAVELGAPGTDKADLDRAARLLRLAREWEQVATGGNGDRHSRHAEVEQWGRRLELARHACCA